MSELYRIGAKFFFRTGTEVPLVDFIPVFHRWIQTSAVDGLLIDVADYSHVPEGPGVILVAHEGIYSIDETCGRRGLAYARRRPHDGSFDECLDDVVSAAAHACRLLEREFPGVIDFSGEELELFVNDRLLGANEDSTDDRLRPHVAALIRRVWPDIECQVTREPNARERFSLGIRAAAGTPFSDVVERVAR